MQENTGTQNSAMAEPIDAEEHSVEQLPTEQSPVAEPPAPQAPAQVPPTPVFEQAAVPERLPTMHDLDQLAIELDAIDRTLAQLDQPVAPAAS